MENSAINNVSGLHQGLKSTFCEIFSALRKPLWSLSIPKKKFQNALTLAFGVNSANYQIALFSGF